MLSLSWEHSIHQTKQVSWWTAQPQAPSSPGVNELIYTNEVTGFRPTSCTETKTNPFVLLLYFNVTYHKCSQVSDAWTDIFIFQKACRWNRSKPNLIGISYKYSWEVTEQSTLKWLIVPISVSSKRVLA